MKTKSLFALFLALLLMLTPLTAYAESYEEVLQKVYDSNVRLITCGAGMYDPQDFASAYAGDDYAQINAKALEITADCKTDRDKAFTINKWVAENVYYDYDYYTHGTHERPSAIPKDVFETGLAVCEGYSTLMRAMCRAAGVPCRMILGQSIYADSYFSEENPPELENAGWHAWNEVYFDGEWHMCDTTWDSRNKYEYGEKNFRTSKDIYFNSDIAEFSKRHYIIQYYDNLKINGGEYYISPKAEGICLTSYKGSKKNVVIPEKLGIEIIGSSAFSSNSTIESVTIPSTVKTINSYAFNGCKNLQTVNMSEGLLTISVGAFYNCTGIKEISIPSTVTTIKNSAFSQCTSLKKVELGNGIETIGTYAFGYCSLLETVRFNGTREEWNAIKTEKGNDYLLNANVITNDDIKESESNSCDHICHKSGISGLIYKIMRIFWKLFGTNQYCTCGAAHY